MSELKLKFVNTIGKEPGGSGKIQITSKELTKHIGEKLYVEVIVHIPD